VEEVGLGPATEGEDNDALQAGEEGEEEGGREEGRREQERRQGYLNDDDLSCHALPFLSHGRLALSFLSSYLSQLGEGHTAVVRECIDKVGLLWE